MKIGRILIATLAITVFEAVVGAVTCGGVFNWVYQLEPVNVWKPMEAPGVTYYIGAIILNFIFVLIYAALRKGIPGKNKLIKGLVFGLCVWAVGMLPGMFATYMFMTVAPTVIIYWTIMGLIQSPLHGLIASSIYGE
ncbi:MAG: hypothetical protein JW728_07600 [Candidatus Aureabacteria bacterium]|nr:hypothetical protein [Candidatus Auribacterota bacterium]